MDFRFPNTATSQSVSVMQRLIESLVGARSAKEIHSILRQTSSSVEGFFPRTDDDPYFYAGFAIELGPQRILRGTTDGLNQAKALGLTCAPQLVSQFPLADGLSCVVTFLTECDGQRPQRVDANSPLSEAAATCLVDEMRRLGEKGLILPSVATMETWRLHPKKGHVVLDGWHELQPGSPDRIAEIDRELATEILTFR